MPRDGTANKNISTNMAPYFIKTLLYLNEITFIIKLCNIRDKCFQLNEITNL